MVGLEGFEPACLFVPNGSRKLTMKLATFPEFAMIG